MSLDLRLPRRLVLGFALLALVAVLTSGWVLALWAPTTVIGRDALSVLTGVIAAVCCAAAAVANRGSMRIAWSLFTLLMTMYAVGDVLWLVFGVGDEDTLILSLADALYMGAFVPATLGLVVYPVLSEVRGRWWPLLLDAVVVLAAALFLSHVLVLHEVFSGAGSLVEAFLLTVYPVTDVLFASLALLLLLRSIGRPRLDVVLLGATFAIYAGADNGYALMAMRGQDSTGTLVDVGYAVAPLVLAAAALVAVLTPTPRRPLRRHLTGVVAPLIPDLTALVAIAAALTVGARDGVSVALGLTTLTAVGLRQVAQTRSGHGLRTELRRRVTDRTRELDEMTEHYRRLDAMKYEFVSAVSHELRTPLSAIRGSLEMLQEGDAGALPLPATRVVALAARGSERLSRLVNDIIDLERLESGGFGFAPSLSDVSDLVAEATQSMLPLAHEREVDLLIQTAAGQAWCDPDRVVQVLVNLVGNALKFSPPRSTVTVTAERSDHEFVVSVRDEGRGLPASELEAVFRRFHQVEVDDAREKGGAGLGLTISQRIIDKHGGRIWVESPGEAGATFRFTLPCAAPSAGAVRPPDGRAGIVSGRSA